MLGAIDMDIKQQKINQEYQNYVKSTMPKSNILKNCIMAFLIGGLICTIGQLITNIGINYYGLNKQDAGTFTSIILIFLSALLTGLGIYDDIAKVAGAGTIVPITGFANSIVSPAMEFKREGYVFGVGAKMFSIAGPVLVYGIGTSTIVGLLYYLFGR
jgi:stage V sporulation protein AC